MPDQDSTPAGMIAALTTATLRAMEAMSTQARHLHPAEFAPPAPDAALPQALAASRAFAWPDRWAPVRDCLERAATAMAEGQAALAEATTMPEAWRALRALPRAMEAIYPLAAFLPAISRYFLEPALREDAALAARLAAAPPGRDGVGVMHLDAPAGTRGACSLYVPEYYDAARPWPLVVALHGGHGDGARFLWNWVRAARGQGVAVLAPTALGTTWSILEPELDGPNIARMIAEVSARWNLDPARRLLTGMSDGGSFTYSLGLSAEPAFSHLAPVAANFHPVLTMAMNPEHSRGLPIRILHGARDWMFPPDVALSAAQLLRQVGARVECHIAAGLGHNYPMEESAAILDWFLGV